MIKYTKEYDETDPISIEDYAQLLIGRTFRDVIEKDSLTISYIRENSSYGTAHENTKRKGGLGELIEECFFHYKCNNESEPDFPHAGCELKVTPYKINKNKSLSAKERLVITMIDYMQVYKESFENSHLWRKARLILLIYYLWEPDMDRLSYKIHFAKLFSPPRQDVEIIKHDYEIILHKIKSGKAHELSGSDTLYLEACTKASTSSDRRPQPFNDVPAKPRAFALKASYMTYVLNTYIAPGKSTYEPIVTDFTGLPFEAYVEEKLTPYIGYSVEDLCRKFYICTTKRPKNLEALLAYRILGIKGNHAQEFIKAGIAVKTVRVEHNNRIIENMSFPTFKFRELVKETWETSTFGNYLSNTRFFFIVYKYDKNNILHLKGCQFWNIPYNDLEFDVKSVWEKTRRIVKEGLKTEIRNGRNTSNLPKRTESPVCHVRPHGRNSQDMDELPYGGKYPKQCFWLNNTYILSQLNKKFLD